MPQQQPQTASSSMKGNDGRGARRKYMRNALVVAGLFGCMFLISLVGQRIASPPHTSSSSSAIGSRISEHDRRNMIRKQRHGGLLNHMRHDAEEQVDNDASLLQGILEGRLHIIDIRPMSGRSSLRSMLLDNRDTKSGGGGYRGLFMASFCHLDWSLPKADPSTTPMFRWLVEKSPDCSTAGNPHEVDLYDIVQKVQQFDAQNPQKVKLLNLSGVVFHESRCGSTLVANVLAAMNPAQHRVYSESSPPIEIMRLAEGDGGGGNAALSVPQAAEILKHVVYLMSRSDDFQEERVFFKIQSIGTRSLNVFQRAFPTTPWIFVYRDPVQVMMSHLGKIRDPRQANCVRPQQSPVAAAVKRVVAKYSSDAQQSARDLSYQDFCAAHLASLTETALEHMLNSSSSDNSIPVNYATLPDIMWMDILPNHWHVPTGPDEIQRMQLVATQYSKQGKGGPADSGVEFTGDSQKKDEAASPAIRMAAQRYLQPSFEALEKLAARAKMH